MKKGLAVAAALIAGGTAIATLSTSVAIAQPPVMGAAVFAAEDDDEDLPDDPGGNDEPGSITNSSCTQAKQSVQTFGVDKSEIYDAGVVTIGDWRIPFKKDGYKAVHPSNPAMTQAFYSFGWLAPETDADVSKSIDVFVAQAKANPDPGQSIDKKLLPDVGWSESAVTLRLKTALCLYRAATTDAERNKLMPALDALIAANMDENRYYGPPRVKPHNHGVMADRELLNAANYLGRPELADFAKKRLQTQMDGLYDSCGFTYEQSNGYQHFHASLWDQVARRIDNDPQFQQRILDQIVKIKAAANAVTYPDGNTPRIGDGSMKSTDDLAAVNKNLTLLCPDTGWFSWREKYDGVQQQVVARFGPATNYHGHADKGAVVWWARPTANTTGVEVLADRGLPGKNRDANYDYAVGASAHATLLWDGGSSLRLSGTSERSNGIVTLKMAGSNTKGGDWNRTVKMNSRKTVLRIEDSLAGKAADRPATQNLPLNPVWQKTASTDTYKTASGLTLTIACTTDKGVAIPVKREAVMDYQTDSPRNAFTASCTIDKGSLGANAVLTVTGG